jgi:ABC-2 type transport system ATP-binding protein
LYRRMKIADQLRFFAEIKNVRGKEVDAKIDQWLERVKLPEWKYKRSMELSKGMQQKIQFITCVIHDPDLLILDEPFSGLDPINVELLKEVVLDLKRAGKTIIFSTHQMEVAEKICDDICLLNKSQKVFEGSLRDIKRSFGRNSVAVRCEGGDGVLDDPALVSKLVRHVDEAQALLAEGADAQVLLKRLIAAGAVIGKFEMVEPSLNDIFITKVTEAA